MSKGGGKQVTTTAVDPTTAAYQDKIRGTAGKAASGYSTVGPNDATTGALDTYKQYAGAGVNGLAALSGDPTAMAKFMNPYQQQVIDASNANFAKTNAMVGNAADSAATAAGAFGGSRAAVVKGAAQGEAQGQHDAQIAGLLDQGYSDAASRAGGVANLGFGANGAIANMGDYLRSIQQQQANPDEQRLRLLQSGVTAPNTTTTTAPGQRRNVLSGMLGGAISGFAATGSPWGAAAGAGAGIWG